MDKLPNEMLRKIFQNVDQVDQLLNCKTVCKKWYSIIHETIRLNSLVISEVKYHRILSEKWFDPNESIQFLYDYRYKASSLNLGIVKFDMKQPLFSQLKKLFVYYGNIWANSINCLRHLEVLGLKLTSLVSETDASLNLPNLKIFSLVNNDHYQNLTLNCPKLKKLAYFRNYGSLSFIHPESIKELHACCREDFIYNLINCEYLYIEYYRYEPFDRNILLKLTKLKELHLDTKDFGSVNSFIDQKSSLKRTNLKIYFLSLLSDSVSPNILNQIAYSFDRESIDIDSIQFYGPNYLNLTNNVYFIYFNVDYNVIENYFWDNSNQVAREIIKKLVYLDVLILSDEIRDVNQFIGILKDRVYLNTLSITAEFMPQNFFDQILSENCSIIEQLAIDNKNQLNFDFLLKFKELQCFKTDQQLTSDLIFKLFDKFESLRSLRFRYKGSEVEIDILIDLQVGRLFKLCLDGFKKIFNNLEDLMSRLEIYHHKTSFSSDDCFDNFIFKS